MSILEIVQIFPLQLGLQLRLRVRVLGTKVQTIARKYFGPFLTTIVISINLLLYYSSKRSRRKTEQNRKEKEKDLEENV